MAVPNIRIDIASVFKDKGFKDASKASSGLEKSFAALGKTFLTVFSAAAIVKFGKESVRAFAEEEKAVKRLEQTLKGVNLGFTAPAVESYLKNLEDSTYVADDLLRPALEKLIRTTGSVSASQDILATAIDISAGSGFDLITVANDLGRAYLGNARGLAKYNTTLTRTDLQTKSFSDIQKVLNDQFSGQRSAFLTTYAGKLEMIDTAYGRMQETIGEGLVDAFGMLSGEQGIAGATTAMEEFGTITADVIRGVGSLVGQLTAQMGGSGGLQSFIDLASKTGNPLGQALKALQTRGAAARPLQFPTLGIGQPGYAAQQKKIEEEAAKRARAQEALRLKEIKQREKIAKLKKLSNMLEQQANRFDEKRIQLTAALLNPRLKAEERRRLEELLLIEETKAAIQEGDLEKAEKLFEKLTNLQSQTETLAQTLIGLEAGNPFERWEEYFLGAHGLIEQLQLALDNIRVSLEEMLKEAQMRSAAAQANLLAAKSDKITAYAEATKATQLSAELALAAADKAIADALADIAAAVTPEQKDAAEAFLDGALAAKDAAETLMESVSAAELATALAATDLANELEYEANMALAQMGILPDSIYEQRIADATLTGVSRVAAEGAGDLQITVNVAGNVMTAQDLATEIQEQLYVNQKSGTGLLYSAVAI